MVGRASLALRTDGAGGRPHGVGEEGHVVEVRAGDFFPGRFGCFGRRSVFGQGQG